MIWMVVGMRWDDGGEKERIRRCWDWCYRSSNVVLSQSVTSPHNALRRVLSLMHMLQTQSPLHQVAPLWKMWFQPLDRQLCFGHSPQQVGQLRKQLDSTALMESALCCNVVNPQTPIITAFSSFLHLLCHTSLFFLFQCQWCLMFLWRSW